MQIITIITIAKENLGILGVFSDSGNKLKNRVPKIILTDLSF
jgi:hypothetical protein